MGADRQHADDLGGFWSFPAMARPGTPFAKCSPMNTIFFGLKRSYYATLIGARTLTKRYGLTPARFDLMFLLQDVEQSQSSLWAALGVSRSTVSRMLQSLEELGLIERSRGYFGRIDRRQRTVSLTQKGAELLKRALSGVLGTGISDIMMRSTAALYDYSRVGIESAIRDLEWHFRAIQETFRGRGKALSLYEWETWLVHDPFEFVS